MLSGGGTGGHIYPAIAIANCLKTRFPKAEFLFVGAKDRMEMQKVPEAGFKIKGLWISGFQRRLSIANLLFPVKLLFSLFKAKKIIKKYNPDVVIGTGGFASGPLLKVASHTHIPCLIQEQNSYPGITNKLLAKGVQTICVAYSGLETYFPKEKIVLTGNPIRQTLINNNFNEELAKTSFELKSNKTTILVVGGSLGALRIHQLIEEKVSFFNDLNVQLIWQCGKLYYDTYKTFNSKNNIKVVDFISEMDQAYAAADVIISRAGASSVSELCVVGKPVIFIPSPNVAEDHQTKNAQAITSQSAAILIKETDLEKSFEYEFEQLINSVKKQIEYSKNIKALALPNATENIVDEIEKLLDNR